jgi:hypothetical protein
MRHFTKHFTVQQINFTEGRLILVCYRSVMHARCMSWWAWHGMITDRWCVTNVSQPAGTWRQTDVTDHRVDSTLRCGHGAAQYWASPMNRSVSVNRQLLQAPRCTARHHNARTHAAWNERVNEMCVGFVGWIGTVSTQCSDNCCRDY